MSWVRSPHPARRTALLRPAVPPRPGPEVTGWARGTERTRPRHPGLRTGVVEPTRAQGDGDTRALRALAVPLLRAAARDPRGSGGHGLRPAPRAAAATRAGPAPAPALRGTGRRAGWREVSPAKRARREADVDDLDDLDVEYDDG